MTNKNVAEGKLTPDDIATGSVIAALMNQNPFMTANDVLQRAFDAHNKIPPKKLTFEALHWGTQFEVPIIEEACRRLELDGLTTNFGRAFYHDEYPMAVSLDATVEGDGRELVTDPDKGIYCANADRIFLKGKGIIEAKLTSHESELELPPYRGRLQLQMAMDIMDCDWGAVTVLHKGIKLVTHVFKRDNQLINELRDAAVDFKKRVDKYKEADETDWYQFTSTRSAANIFDEANDSILAIPALEKDIQTITEIRDNIKDLEQQLEATQASVMGSMGAAKILMAGKYKVTWPTMNYRAVPEKIVPAKEARTIRINKLRIKEND